MPYLSRAADRPLITHGVQSGDVGADGGVVWARADRPSQMMVEVSTTESFRNARAAAADHRAARERLHRQRCCWKICPPDRRSSIASDSVTSSHPDVSSEPAVGRFRTAPADRRDVSFVWGGDVAGQGWGINPDDGGMFTFATMRKHRPDFLLHSGDTIYADGPIESEVKLADGKVWKNVTIPEKAKVAETLDEFRAAHKYNFLDEHLRAFNAEVPVFVQWDDHEVDQQLVALKTASRRLQGARHRIARRARGPRLPRNVSDAREHQSSPGGSTARSNYGPHLDVFMLDERSYRGPNGAEPADRATVPKATSSDPTSWPG